MKSRLRELRRQRDTLFDRERAVVDRITEAVIEARDADLAELRQQRRAIRDELDTVLTALPELEIRIRLGRQA